MLKSKKNIILCFIAIVLTLFVVMTFSKKDIIKDVALQKYSEIKNNSFKNYLKRNEDRMSLNTCLNDNELVIYYNDVYKKIINSLYDLDKLNLVSTSERKNIFRLLKYGKIQELNIAITRLNLSKLTASSLAEKNYLLALSAELNFLSENIINNFYNEAKRLNNFDIKLYSAQADYFYKNCKFDSAINSLLQVKSIVANNSDIDLVYKNYKMLGDIYFIKRDYENSLAYYTNTLIYGDFYNNNKNKFDILSKIGDVMYARGDLFEAINYYKYAMTINSKINKIKKLNTILSLSESYYMYGNYENSIKFANLVLKKAGKGNNLFNLQANFINCVNYEQLNDINSTKKYCEKVKKSMKELFAKNDKDFLLNNYIGFIYNYSPFLKNDNLSKIHFLNALSLSSRNPLNKISVLENLLSYYSFAEKNKDEVLKTNKELNDYYNKYNIGRGSYTLLNIGVFKNDNYLKNKQDNIEFLSAEKELKNSKRQLFVVYTYLTNFYKHTNKQLYEMYKNKAVLLSKQLFKYNSSNIFYAENL